MKANSQISTSRKIFASIALMSILVSFLGTGTPPAAKAQESTPPIPTEEESTPEPKKIKPAEPIPSQVIIKFKDKTSKKNKEATVKEHSGTVVQRIDALNLMIIKLPNGKGPKNVNSPFVESVEQDYFIESLDEVIPNDPRYSEQWALPAIGAPEAWAQLPADAPQVTVAVIDSGICADHPDLSGRILDGWDFLESDAVPQDDFGHGCSVAGIIAANMNDGNGIAGVAPNAQIMPLRVLNASGMGSYSDVAAAIVYAADNGAQVINLSLGGSSPSTALENAVNYAITKSVIVVAAAGNNGTEGALYPAAYPDVVAVGSVDPDLQHSSFSNYGVQIDIWAPGRDILTTKRDGSYSLVSGTSFAAPYVAGAEALMVAQEKILMVKDFLNIDSENSIPTKTPSSTETPIAPTTTAQPTTAQPTMLTPIDSDISREVLSAVQVSIKHEGAILTEPGSILEMDLSTLRIEGDWAYIFLYSTYLDKDSNSYLHTPNSNLILSIIHKKAEIWTALLPARDHAKEYNSLLVALPDSLLSREQKTIYLVPEDVKTQTVYSYESPWPRGSGSTIAQGMHQGNSIDFFIDNYYASTSYVLAAKSGTIQYIKEDSSTECSSDTSWCYQQDNILVIKHSNDEYTWYTHLEQWSVPDWITVGTYVEAGTVIGREGATGYAVPAGTKHLHFMASDCYNFGTMAWPVNCTLAFSFNGQSGNSATWQRDTRVGSNNTLARTRNVIIVYSAPNYDNISGTAYLIVPDLEKITIYSLPSWIENQASSIWVGSDVCTYLYSVPADDLSLPAASESDWANQAPWQWVGDSVPNLGSMFWRNTDLDIDAGSPEFTSRNLDNDINTLVTGRKCLAALENGVVAQGSCFNGPGGGSNCSLTSIPSGYNYCADENSTCSFSGTGDVIYGANSCYTSPRSFNNSVSCNNSTFGDPIPNVGKKCYVKITVQSCNPNSDQIALYEHPDYGGTCKVLGIGDYTNPAAMGFPNDAVSSIKVGGNVKAILYENDGYNGTSEEFIGDDIDFGNNSIGHDRVSSLKVQTRGTGLDCGQVSYTGVILYEHPTCNKYANGKTKAFPSSTGWIDIVSDFNDIASSIYVSNGWSIKVFEHDINGGGGSWRCVNGSMWDLGIDKYTNGNTNLIINDTISSIQVYNNTSCYAPTTSIFSISSSGNYDGYILESSETSGIGGTQSSIASSTISIGDNASNRQSRAILSFDTSYLPDTAIITAVTLKFKYYGKTGTLPFSTHGKLLADIRKGTFSNNINLQLGDFKAKASKNAVLSFGNSSVDGWYSKLLDPANFIYINKAGVTQFRLRFTKDDNNDSGADYLKIYSGNAPMSYSPWLIIEYYVP